MGQEYCSPWLLHWPGGQEILHGILADTLGTSTFSHEIIEAGNQRVSDTLTDVEDFSNARAVLIDAPTGSGKSTFVLQTLSEYARRQNKYILFLSNRSTLNLQNKLLASTDRPLIGRTALSHVTVIGNLLLCSYHHILSLLPNIRHISWELWRSSQPIDIGYIVLDEAHFFCSDATFNRKTSRILREILMAYCRSQRIYMSATMEDVRPLILYEEKMALSLRKRYGNDQYQRIWDASHPLVVKDYRFKADYSSVHLHFFVDWESIKHEIGNSDSKWLVFVSDTEQGKALANNIDDAKFINSAYVQANPDESMAMVDREKFAGKVLIATSVFDSGINFHDDDLQNIVVDSEDMIQITQMLGRKRRKGNEDVDLYVALNPESKIDRRIRYNQMLQELLQEATWHPNGFIQNKWGSLDNYQQKLFDVWPTGQIVVNAYAPYQLALLESKYQRLKARVSEEHELAFAHEVCKWFGKTYTEEMRCGVSSVESVSAKVVACLEESVQTARPDSQDSNRYLLDKENVVSLAVKLREIVKPILSLFDYATADGTKRNRLHKGSETGHVKADIVWIIKELHLSYALVGSKDTYYLRRTANLDPSEPEEN